MTLLRNIQHAIAAIVPDSLYCAYTNARCALRGYRLRLTFGSMPSTFMAKSDTEAIMIARRNRHRYYKRGVKNRLEQLAGQYCLDRVSFSPDDRIVDCGANIGEIGAWAMQFDTEYVAFEPEELEAACCDVNVFDGERKTHRLALWHENTELTFFSKPDTGDGSLIEIDDYNDVTKVEAVTLSSFIQNLPHPKIRLLKVEAEGAEPEVILGAEAILKHVDYVTVDSGYERGKEKDPTFNEVNEILIRNNFEIVSSNLERLIFLYKRRDCKT